MTVSTIDVASGTADVVNLSSLDEEQRYQRFDRLQRNMPRVWDAMRLNLENESVVVIPSVTLDRLGEGSGSMTQAYEERFLFLLLLLREPRLRMVYVTSTPIAPAIIEYYLALLPGVIPSHAHARLTFVSVGDATPRPLSQKLLERPRLIQRIAALIPDRSLCHLIPYNTTELERDLAVALGIPMYGADPRLVHLGTKTGCRRLFAEEGVRHPLGYEGPARPRRRRRRRGLDAPAAGRRPPRSSSSSTRASPVRATRWSTCATFRHRATRSERSEIIARLRQMQFERPDTPLDAVPEQARRARRHRRGAHLRGRDPQPQRAAPRHAGRRRRVAVHPRPGARRAERTELPRLPVPGRLQLRPGDQRRGDRSSVPASPARA